MMLLGCIADDFTGASDLANTLARGGMRTMLYVGIPQAPAPGAEAGVVALKTRTVPAVEAVAQSLAALAWLRGQGCGQIFFKYCSTFDSTPEGNIGPVTEALMHALGTRTAFVCPAFPATGRRVFQGHLFVGDRLLHQSGMQDHPLTPMTDPDLRRWLALQTKLRVGHAPHDIVAQGVAAVQARLRSIAAELADGEAAMIVADAVTDADLVTLGTAAADHLLVTGGSGMAVGLPTNFGRAGRLSSSQSSWRGEAGRCAILSGSCSIATRDQIAVHSAAEPALLVDPDAIMSGAVTAPDAADWVITRPTSSLPLVYTTATPQAVRAAQSRHGAGAVATAIEAFFAELAPRLVASGVSRLVTAGGETSSAVVAGLGLSALAIGPEISPGVPALRAENAALVLALKSGNFGGPDFFARAAAVLAA